MFSDLFIREIHICEDKREACYAFSLPSFTQFSDFAFNKQVTFIVGENGSGKSTFLEGIAIASGFNAEGGTRNFNFASEETHSSFHNYLKLSRGIKRPKDGFFLRAESFYNVSSEVDRLEKVYGGNFIDCYGGKSLHEQSHGESFMALMCNRFRGNGLYILDEPEAALSPMRQMAFLARLHELVQTGSQFIIATHSPIIMAYPNAEIYVMDEQGINCTPYEMTEHFIITKQFINNPDKYMRYLFEQ